MGVTLEAITKPFNDENEVELESELKLYWLEGEQTGGWLSSHFDIVDKFSPAKRPTDTRAYTHKLNLELDTAVAVSAAFAKVTGFAMLESRARSTMSRPDFRETPAAGRFPSCSSFRSSRAGKSQDATKTRIFFGRTYRRSPIFGFSVS